MHSTLLLVSTAVALAAGADDALKPWSTNTHPTDVAKSHVEEITTGLHKYTVVQGGTMDGRNCRSPMGCGIAREGAFLQTWESNRSVRMENVGQTDVVNPWLSNGRNNFRNVDEIVAAAVTPDMTDAEKAFALWFQEIQYRHHSPGDNNELGDPVKVFNVYGYNTCGNDSICLATLWRKAGLKAAPARALGHCISQAFYDSRWHFYDGDMHSVYLLRDNQTVAGEQDIVRDHDLVKRTHSKGILLPDTWWDGQGMCAMYFYEGEVTGERGGKADTTMNMVLRPGEAIVWRWGQLDPGQVSRGAEDDAHLPVADLQRPVGVSPGLLQGDLAQGGRQRGEHHLRPRRPGRRGGQDGHDRLDDAQPLRLRGRPAIEARDRSSGGRRSSSSPWTARPGRRVKDNLDRFFSIVGPARYEYKLKCQLEGAARLRRLAIINDVQMAPMALPEMVVGENAFTYTDQSGEDGWQPSRCASRTSGWSGRPRSRRRRRRRRSTRPTAASPTAPTSSSSGRPPRIPTATRSRDYHFELSSRADMRWPLSMGFYKLISRTADVDQGKGKDGQRQGHRQGPVHLVSAGPADARPAVLLARAGDGRQGRVGAVEQDLELHRPRPGVSAERDPRLRPGQGRGDSPLEANPVGTSPVKYRVYGSDEKGFTIADKTFQSTVGVTKEEMAAWNPWFPANFIAETTATELAVMGREVDLPAANKTYYRVVAVDEQGKRSGPSDYAAGPRPVIYSKPVLAAKVGAEYRYQVRANRSLGDLSARMKGGNQVSGYFDIEKPKFALEQGPAWLKIDHATGVLSGTPDAAGKVEVAVTATIDREVRKLDEKVLVWGNEKVLSTTTERVGTATQKFVIDVQ